MVAEEELFTFGPKRAKVVKFISWIVSGFRCQHPRIPIVVQYYSSKKSDERSDTNIVDSERSSAKVTSIYYVCFWTHGTFVENGFFNCEHHIIVKLRKFRK